MSKNNLYIETEVPYYSTNFHSMNNSYLDSLYIPTEKGPSYTSTLSQLPNLDLNKKKAKKSAQNIRSSHLPFDNNYLKERYNKVKEENSYLKKKLFESEKNFKIKKGQMEEQILVLRDENTNLQIQIQKTIEKQKSMYKNSDNISIENKSLLNKINLMNIDINTLNDKITMKNADVEEKNKIINDLLKEKNVFIKEEKMLKNQINELMKDKEVLIKQIQELNLIIGEKISPKLKQNENTLINLQKQIERLRINNEKFKSDNTLLFNENKMQKNLITILTKQNKKLLGEIRTVYDRDILLMDNMEKMGSNNNEQFKLLIDKNKNIFNSQNLLKEELDILKQNQKYINVEDNDNDNDNKAKNNNIKKVVKNKGQNNMYKKFNIDMKNKISNNIYKKNHYISKSSAELNNISSFNNDIIIKKNKENINIDGNDAKANHTYINSNIQNNLYNNNNSYDNINTDIKYNNNSNIYQDNIDDIKTSREKLNSQNLNSFLKNDDNDIQEGKNYQTDPLDINYKNNNFEETQKVELNNSENNQNTLFKSQAKSLLSEYVEDLDII